MSPVEFATRYIAEQDDLHLLTASDRKRILVRYVRARRSHESESARQLLRIDVDMAMAKAQQDDMPHIDGCICRRCH